MHSGPPGGVCRTALCSRLRVSSRSIHSCAGSVSGSACRLKSSARSAIRGDSSSATSRTMVSKALADASACCRSCATLASASIWLASSVARSTVSSISASACAGGTSPRRADCTCAFSTASGVRSWCEASRTKRFWLASISPCRRMCWLVAAISGCSSRGAVGAAIGRRSSSGRSCSSWLSWRTGRVARCTTQNTVPAMSRISAAWRSSVSHRIWRASARRISSVSATCTTAMARPVVLATGCSSTAMRTGSPRNCPS